MKESRNINKPMKLVFVTDSQNGVLYAGCRAEGIHKGRRIERTAWCESCDFEMNINDLERLAVCRYKAEMREIDKVIK